MNRNRLCEFSLCVTALAIVVNGVTAQPYEPHWSDEFPSAELDAWVQGMGVFDDGSGNGPALYIGGGFTTGGDVTLNGIARLDGNRRAPLGSGVDGAVWALAVFDDNSGDGPALFAGGEFTTAGGVSSQRIAKWVGCGSAVVGDLDGDGSVGITDLLILLSAWGPCPDPPDPCPADLNGDGTVGILDLLTLLANWGP